MDPTQEDIDAVVPERWKGRPLTELPPGLQALVERRIELNPQIVEEGP